jgi:hypothetical protein
MPTSEQDADKSGRAIHDCGVTCTSDQCIDYPNALSIESCEMTEKWLSPGLKQSKNAPRPGCTVVLDQAPAPAKRAQ